MPEQSQRNHKRFFTLFTFSRAIMAEIVSSGDVVLLMDRPFDLICGRYSLSYIQESKEQWWRPSERWRRTTSRRRETCILELKCLTSSSCALELGPRLGHSSSSSSPTSRRSRNHGSMCREDDRRRRSSATVVLAIQWHWVYLLQSSV